MNGYLFFHSFVELFSAIIAWGMFAVAWNSRRYLQHSFFLFLGAAFAAVGTIDLIHALAYKGMGVFPGASSDLPTQLWMAARSLGAVSLLLAPAFLERRVRFVWLAGAYVAVTAGLLAAIFGGWFPACYVESADGLTPFKVASEYAICAMTAVAMWMLWRRRQRFDRRVLRLLLGAMLLLIVSELAFTLYADIYGVVNTTGHLLKVAAFGLLYWAIIVTGLQEPYRTLFRELHESEQRLRWALQAGSGGAWDWNPATDETWWSRELYDLWGIAPGTKMTLRDSLAMIDAEDRDRVEEAIRQVTADSQDYWCEFRIHHPTRGERWMVAHARQVCDESGEPARLLGITMDITDRKQAEEALRAANEELEAGIRKRTAALSRAVETLRGEVTLRKAAEDDLRERTEQLRALASELTLVEQRERRRLAEVLHDDLQQLLVAARFRLNTLRKGPQPCCKEVADDVQELLKQSITCSRTLTGELSPSVLHHGGLIPALQWLAERMKNQHEFSVEVRANEEVEAASDDMRILLFQSVRELLFNAVKHAGVMSARVEATVSDDHIELVIADEGVGFDPRQAKTQAGKPGGFGLLSIRERLDLLGGRLEIDSAPGRGSRFTLTVPCEPTGTAAG